MASCPTCKREVAPRDENAAFPFCSPRCRAVDLGRWFTGAYTVAGRITEREGGEPAVEEPAPAPAGRKTDG
jgi:endogenous inhibitor of DNA gyrase (YacG/DUF329 family)